VARTVSSRQNPLVRAFRDAAESPDAEGRQILLDGLNLVRDAHAAGITLDTVAITHQRADSGDEGSSFVHDLDRSGVDVVLVGEQVMAAISPVRSPSGIVALGTRKGTTIDAICAAPRALVIVAVDVQDPGNVGALCRAAEAGNATGVIVCGASAQPFSWKALRGSMGSLLRLPVVSVATPQIAMDAVSRARLATRATVPRGGMPMTDIDWTPPAAVFVGAEGSGLPEDVVTGCDERVTIPMQAPVESLNVAVAAALLVYEARRQREGL
jgi:RNA methyltransferase, TrmH family